MKKTIVVLLLFGFAICAFKEIRGIYFRYPSYWPKPIYNFNKNQLRTEKTFLGRVLFYDPILSKDSNISCASCHSQHTAFSQIDHSYSKGINHQIGKRNAPALINLAWNSSFMWDGAVNNLEVQALAPMSNPTEMNETIGHVADKMKHTTIYPKLFYKAFGDSAINGERVLKCITQFMLSLVSCHSKYDSVMEKQAKFTQQEERGYLLFKKNCSSCHKEPLFTNDKFENNGLPINKTLNDVGRMLITHDSANYLQFRVPTLRNIQISYPYMHDGRFSNLVQVLNHYTKGIVRSNSLAKPLLKPILLTNNDKKNLIAFLSTLSDTTFITEKQYSFPVFVN